ncbi:MAG: hypothetical protein R3199_05935 [Gemmatimonadota bacterium]|nr:hypothetical protein [Gemmatimonadota bacterium]
MGRRSYVVFWILTVAWMGASALAYEMRYGWFVASALVWWGLVVMAIAGAYYAIQEAPAARVTGWLKRDLAINAAMVLLALFLILDGINGYVHTSLRSAGWIAFAMAAIHPIAVDLPHRRHQRDDPAGSPVPQYVPPACVWIDWTLAGLLLLALALL